jgi:exportin-1
MRPEVIKQLDFIIKIN